MEDTKKLLVIVDMQNDFITGALANKEGQAMLPKLVEYAKNFDGDIACTLDSHFDNYMTTQEGKKLPVKHCICGTKGWQLIPELKAALSDRMEEIDFIQKETFGSVDLGEKVDYDEYDEVYLCGVCTDICVISNALLIKAFNPDVEINVLSELCAGVTPESHQTALDAMKACQINII